LFTQFSARPATQALGKNFISKLAILADEYKGLTPSSGKNFIVREQQGDVNWSQHAPSGAYLQYLILDQLFPEPIIVPVQKDFPN
jgi:hypothetical protein